MYHFTESDLKIKSVAQLKDAYSQIGCTELVTDKRTKASWVQAILTHQSAQIELVAVAEVKLDEQAVAQTELEAHIIDQAATVAPEITTVEISFYDHEIYALGKQIASITYDPDDFQTQRWVVMVGETEVHRADAWAKCHSYITWHYKQGTLPADLSVATLPILVETVATEIEIDSVIDADFGTLYRVWDSRTLLGTFYCAADNKWVAQPSDSDDRPRCDTAAQAQLLIVAMAGLLVADTSSEVVDLLDKPVDELTVAEWQTLKMRQQQAELVAA